MWCNTAILLDLNKGVVLYFALKQRCCAILLAQARVWCITFGHKQGCGAIFWLKQGCGSIHFDLNNGVVQYFWT